MSPDLISWAATIIGIGGTIAINYKSRIGMILWLISNAIWIYFDIFVVPNHAQTVMYIVFSVINGHGLYRWTVDKKGNKDATKR
jgi:nicotinamide riboside transporter PnuC